MTDRRLFFRAVAGALFTVPLGVKAQKVHRIGYLALNAPESGKHPLDAFRQVLRERGWIEGQNVIIESRFAEGSVDRLSTLAAELIRLKVDIIVTGASVATRAAKNGTKTIPIVMAASADALGEGFVTSLAHPGGNITGVTFRAGAEIAGKQLQLLKEVTRGVSPVAVLMNPTNGSHKAFVEEVKVAAGSLGTQIQILEASYPNQLERSFTTLTRERAAALLVLTDSMFFGQRQHIAHLAAKSGVPALYSQREFVDAGGLVSYGPSLTEMFRRAATHVDKILRGFEPREIPVEQPTKFELVVNLRTAKALGIAVPQSLLLRADDVIQ